MNRGIKGARTIQLKPNSKALIIHGGAWVEVVESEGKLVVLAHSETAPHDGLILGTISADGQIRRWSNDASDI